MESDPVTLGDWFEILKPSDYAEAATFVNGGRPTPPWIPIFLMHWAPELINGRKKWERAQNRKFVLDRLAAKYQRDLGDIARYAAGDSHLQALEKIGRG